jgi:hypothetical protein
MIGPRSNISATVCGLAKAAQLAVVMGRHIVTGEFIPGCYVAFCVELYSPIRNAYENIRVARMVYVLKGPTPDASIYRLAEA